MIKKAFIEFGCCERPNLAHLLVEGWHGVFVEPHPLSIIRSIEYLNTLENVSYDFYAGVVTGRTQQFAPYKSGSEGFSESGYMAEVGGVRSDTWNSGFWEAHKSPGLTFKTITLDELVARCLYPISHFEIDCEGMEIEIFESYSWDCKPDTMTIALHGEEHLERLINIITKAGYKFRNSANDALFDLLFELKR